MGKKWICISAVHVEGYGTTDDVKIGGIYTANYFDTHDGYDWIGFEECPQDDCYFMRDFRLVDDTFAADVLENIKEQIKEEQLIAGLDAFFRAAHVTILIPKP